VISKHIFRKVFHSFVISKHIFRKVFHSFVISKHIFRKIFHKSGLPGLHLPGTGLHLPGTGLHLLAGRPFDAVVRSNDPRPGKKRTGISPRFR